MTIPPILKNKWVLIGGAVVILIALLMSSKSTGTTGGVITGSSTVVSDAQVAASRDITIAQLAAQGQTNAANAQIAIIGAQGNIELSKATMDSALSKYAIDAQTSLQGSQLDLQRLQVNTTAQIQLAALSSDERRETAAINSQTQLAKWTLDQATMNTQIQADFQLGYAEAANQTQISLMQMQSQLVNNQLIVGRDVQLAGIASQVDMAALNANLQRDVTFSNNQTQQAVYASMTNGQVETARIEATNKTEQARIAGSVSKHQSTMGTIGSVVGGILSIFSDPRLKENAVKIAEYSDGLGVYVYDYKWGGSPQHGVMADEVARLRPWALGPIVDGYATVNYAAL